jgi:hypothetical protein
MLSRSSRKVVVNERVALHKTKASGEVRRGRGSGKKTTIPARKTVDVDDSKSNTDSRGNRYLRATYGSYQGWVKEVYVTAATEDIAVDAPRDELDPGPQSRLREVEQTSSETSTESAEEPETEDLNANLSKGPKAGFELEFPSVFVLPDLAARPVDRGEQLLWDVLAAGRSKQPLGPVLTALANRRKAEPYYGKRTLLFKAPHGTWGGTTDTTLPWVSNLEIVSRALTPDEMETDEAASDWEVLETVVETLREGGDKLLALEDLHEDLVVVEAAVLINMTNPKGPDDHLQLTQAEKPDAAGRTAPAGDWNGEWLPGLNPAAWPVLLDLIRVLTSTSYTGNNPKNLFGKYLPKSSVLKLLGAPDATVSDDDKKKWPDAVARVAKTMGYPVDLDEQDVAEDLVEATARKPERLVPTMFTWRAFLSGLLNGVDEIALWSKTAFGGEEDFGYGTIEESPGPGWHVVETRELGHPELSDIADAQLEWRKRTRAKQQ